MSRPTSSSTVSQEYPAYPAHAPSSFQPKERLDSFVAPMLATTTRPTLPSLMPDLPRGTSAVPYGYDATYMPISRASTGQIPSGISAVSNPPLVRESRRSNTHVASACVNCKRAHLSCDVQRPCGRCVATGKQDTCFDVQHKKRGRPRLRDDDYYKTETPHSIASASQQPATVSEGQDTSQNTKRPIARVKSKRNDSIRTLHPQASDGLLSSAHAQSSSEAPQQPELQRKPQTHEIPTALVDLDFAVMKANKPFEQIMLDNREATGRQLDEFALPADSTSFQSIKDLMRAEREEKEPAYMPPIAQPGNDFLAGVSEAEVDRLTETSTDHTFVWKLSGPAPGHQTFPVRIRLAKNKVYFLVITLPSFYPVKPPTPPIHPSATQPPYGSFLQGPSPSTRPPTHSPRHIPTDTNSHDPPRRSASVSVPVQAYPPPYPSAGAPHLMQAPPIPSSLTTSIPPHYPARPHSIGYPAQPQLQPQRQSYGPPLPNPSIRRFSHLDPPSELQRSSYQTPPLTSSTSTTTPIPGNLPTDPRRSSTNTPAEFQLPPLKLQQPQTPNMSSAPTLQRIHSAQATPTSVQGQRHPAPPSTGWVSEGETASSPKKRRRMGIDDVLQR